MHNCRSLNPSEPKPSRRIGSCRLELEYIGSAITGELGSFSFCGEVLVKSPKLSAAVLTSACLRLDLDVAVTVPLPTALKKSTSPTSRTSPSRWVADSSQKYSSFHQLRLFGSAAALPFWQLPSDSCSAEVASKKRVVFTDSDHWLLTYCTPASASAFCISAFSSSHLRNHFSSFSHLGRGRSKTVIAAALFSRAEQLDVQCDEADTPGGEHSSNRYLPDLH